MITLEQRQNLAILAAFLATHGPTLDFKMGCYALTDDRDLLEPYQMAKHPCGSVGCAIGHGPVAGIAPADDEEGWNDYAYRAFGASSFKDDDLARKLWHGLFDDAWGDVDNSPEGAAERINHFLKTGELFDPYGERLA